VGCSSFDAVSITGKPVGDFGKAVLLHQVLGEIQNTDPCRVYRRLAVLREVQQWTWITPAGIKLRHPGYRLIERVHYEFNVFGALEVWNAFSRAAVPRPHRRVRLRKEQQSRPSCLHPFAHINI